MVSILYSINKEIPIRYIDTDSELKSFCEQITQSEWLAVDTEFLRESTYYPKFCLLQIANTEQVACIDPLTINDLEPVFGLLYSPNIVKVFHSGRQDLEIFFNLRRSLPSPIFDTQLAAPLVGFTEQISYAALVSDLLGVDLPKAHTRTDWSKRPLSDAQIKYAGHDALYLARIYLLLHDQLSALRRLDWLSDDFAALIDPEIYKNSPKNAWQRIRGAQNLNPKSLGILQSLAEWRERTASENDIPRNWIVKDDVLLNISRLKPSNPDDLGSLRGLHERTFKRYGKPICEVVVQARDNPAVISANKTKPVRKSPQQEILINLLTGIVHQIALEHSLNPATLAPRKDLDLLISGNPDSKLIHGWRKAIVGDTLLAILRGEKIISVKNGVVDLEPRMPERLRIGAQGVAGSNP